MSSPEETPVTRAVPVHVATESQLPEITYTFNHLFGLRDYQSRISIGEEHHSSASPVVVYASYPAPLGVRCLHIVRDEKFWRSVGKIATAPASLTGQIRNLINSALSLPAPRRDEQGLHIEFDCIALSFALLARLEEHVVVESDQYNRFPLQRSALKETLQRPHVDLIARMLSESWGDLTATNNGAKPRPSFTFALTHDIDHLRLYGRLTSELRTMASQLYRRRNVVAVGKLAVGSVKARFTAKDDPYDTLEYLMDTSERAGTLSQFFFMTERSHSRDGGYGPDSPLLQQSIRRVGERGHKIGLHGSFTSYDNLENLKAQKRRLEALAGSPITAIRQHYLRWRTPQTARCQEAAGFQSDYTLGFAEDIGFRAGSASPFQVYDCEQRRVLAIREFGTHIMDVSLFEPCYRNWSFHQALAACESLIDSVVAVQGHLVILWHNSSLNDVLTPGWKSFYEELLSLVIAKNGRGA